MLQFITKSFDESSPLRKFFELFKCKHRFFEEEDYSKGNSDNRPVTCLLASYWLDLNCMNSTPKGKKILLEMKYLVKEKCKF